MMVTLKKNAEGVDVPKIRADCNAEEFKKCEKNAKANKWFVCRFGPDEYNRIQRCSTAKQIWDTLQVTYEGTTHVERYRGTLMYSQYENFVMKDGETTQEMYIRFAIKLLGRNYNYSFHSRVWNKFQLP